MRAIAATVWGPILAWALTLVQPSETPALIVGGALTVGVGVFLRYASALLGPLVAGVVIIACVVAGAAFFGLGQNGGEGASNPAGALILAALYFFAVAACIGAGSALGSGLRIARHFSAR